MKDWRTLLYDRWDAEKSARLATFIASDQNVFDEVFNAFYSETGHIAHRSGFILGQTFKRRPELLLSRIGLLLDQMKNPPHEWYRWMTIWYLSHCNYPADHDGLAATYAFEELGRSYSKPALKNAAMRLMEFICKRNPELIPEFKLYLEEIVATERPTLVAKAKKQMKELEKYV
ncbi:MAG: hypothetical protein RL266_1397 [Bacteroidota bacterium]